MPRVKLFKEEEVLEKAMELFWKKGYYATSVQDLVSWLGINRASLYDTYGDKKQLFNKAFQHYQKTNTEGIQKFLQTQPSVKEGIYHLFKMAIEQSTTDPDHKGCFVVNTTAEMIPNDPEMGAIIKANKQNFEEIFYNFLLSGEQNKEFKPGKNLEAIASLLFTFYNGIKLIAKVEQDNTSLLHSVNALLTVLD